MMSLLVLTRRRPLLLAIGLATLAAFTPADSRAQPGTATFTVLPYVPPGSANLGAQAQDVTNQGLVAGYGVLDSGFFQAVRWESNNAATNLGADPDFSNTVAYSLSGSGQVVCGTATGDSFNDVGAFVWTQAQGIRRLPPIWTSPSAANVVSDNGTTIWGYSTNQFGGPQIVRWNASTLALTAIPTVSVSPQQTGIFDASADGQIAVGYEVTPQATRAVRVTPSGASYLPKPEGGIGSVATGVYPDGSVVVGYGFSGSGVTSPFIWTPGGGARNLPLLNARSTANLAHDVAENGTIVGQDGIDFDGTNPLNETAVIWIAERPFTLKSYLQSEYGLNLSDWSTIQSIQAISRNGRALAGYGIRGGEQRAFRVTFNGDRPPVANAGTDVRKNNAAPAGINVKLDGRKSIDPDGGTLTYRWSGIRFDSPTAARPTAKFPVGTTSVTLKVTDGARASATDTVRVIVKAKRSKIRPQGLAANEAFADAATLTATAARSGEPTDAVLRAAQDAAAATAIGAALGDAFVWGEDESPDGAAADYGALRLLQSAYGQAAAESLATAYLETSDAAYAEAYRSATRGAQQALVDLAD